MATDRPRRRLDPSQALRRSRQALAQGISTRLGLSEGASTGLLLAAGHLPGPDVRMVQWLARYGLADRAAVLLGHAVTTPGLYGPVGDAVDLAAQHALGGRADRARHWIERAEHQIAVARGEAAPRPAGITFYFGDARPGAGGTTGRWEPGTHALTIGAPGGPVGISIERASYEGAWEAARRWGAACGVPLYGSVHDGHPNHRDPREVTDTLGPRITNALCAIDEQARAAGLEL